MFVTPASAQAAGAGAASAFTSFVPLILIFGIMYFLLIRPQQKRAKAHQEMVRNLRRGDTVVMNSGMIGKITKVVDDNEILIDAGDGTNKVQIRVASALIWVRAVDSRARSAKECPSAASRRARSGVLRPVSAGLLTGWR